MSLTSSKLDSLGDKIDTQAVKSTPKKAMAKKAKVPVAENVAKEEVVK